VIIRENETPPIDDDARAEAGLPELLAPPGSAATEELIEEVLEERIVGSGARKDRCTAIVRHLDRPDVDDGGTHFLCNGHERGL
jgi:hypothetical protein